MYIKVEISGDLSSDGWLVANVKGRDGQWTWSMYQIIIDKDINQLKEGVKVRGGGKELQES